MATLPDPHLPDDPPLPPGGWRSGTTGLRIRWRWLERLGFDDLGRLWARCGWDHTVRTWDPVTGEAGDVTCDDDFDPWPNGVKRTPTEVRNLARTRVADASDGREVVVMDLPARRIRWRRRLPEPHGPRLRFGADGGLLALQHRTLSRWDAAGRPLPPIDVPAATVDVLPDGDLLCLGERELVRCDPGGEVRWSVDHRGSAWSRSEDGRRAVWAEGREAVVLDLVEGAVIGRVALDRAWPDRLAISPDGRVLAVGRFLEPMIALYDVPTGRRTTEEAPASHVEKLVATPAGPVSLDARGTLRLHDPASGRILATSDRAWWDVMLLDRERLVATTRSGTVGVLDLPSLRGEPAGSGKGVRLLACGPDRLLLAGHADALVDGPPPDAVWETAGLDGVRTESRPVEGGGAWLGASRAHRGRVGRASGRTLVLVDAQTGTAGPEVGWADGADGPALTGAAAGTDDGGWLVGADDGRVGLLRPGGSALEARLALPEPSPVTALLPLGGGRVAIGYAHGRVRIWDLPTGALLHAWALHLGPVTALVACGGRLVSASEDTTVVAVPLPA